MNDVVEPQREEEREEDASEQRQPAQPKRSRYRIERSGGGTYVVCGNTANIRLKVEKGLSIPEEARKQYPKRTVFLDGVYTGPPFYDNEMRQYSLDHHSGCVRAFTLATCEQAVIMLLQGLPLQEGEWTLYINDPDMDALLAAWVLLNHVELTSEDGRLLRAAMPYIRVEGIIDAHGPDMCVLTGFPTEVYEERRLAIEDLRVHEQQLKAAGQWYDTDFLLYTRRMLEAIDQLIYPQGYLDVLLEMEEAGRIRIRNGKLAVLVRSRQGIYAVESQLKARYNKQLAVIILDAGDGRYTLRQIDPFLRKNLDDLYPALNSRDPLVRESPEGENQWGGSSDIGGSPRKTGTGLSWKDILKLAQLVYGKEGGWSRISRFFQR